MHRLYFTPVHPLNFPFRFLLHESEEPSAGWPTVKRVLDLYEDLDGRYKLMVCFQPQQQPGHIDNVRCFVADLGPRDAYASQHEALQQHPDAGDACERQMLPVLRKVYGDPLH